MIVFTRLGFQTRLVTSLAYITTDESSGVARLVDLGVAWRLKHGVRKFAVADRAGLHSPSYCPLQRHKPSRSCRLEYCIPLELDVIQAGVLMTRDRTIKWYRFLHITLSIINHSSLWCGQLILTASVKTQKFSLSSKSCVVCVWRLQTCFCILSRMQVLVLEGTMDWFRY